MKLFGKKRSNEYARLRRNALNKLKRIQDKFGVDESANIHIPEKKDFHSVKEYNNWKQEIQSFTNRSNTRFQYEKNVHGVVATKKEINELKRQTKKAQRIAEKKIKELEKLPYFNKEEQVGTVGQKYELLKKPNPTGVTVPPDFDFNEVDTRDRLQQLKEQREKRSNPEFFNERDKTFMGNFIRSLYGTLNSYADPVAERILKLDPSDFYEIAQMFTNFDIDEYDSEGYIEMMGNEAEDRANELLSYINRYERGLVSKDLKRFR
jgi:hypothetical protein